MAGSDTPEALAVERRRAYLREQVFTADDLLAQESQAAQNLVGPWVRRECTTILGAHGGHGKSTWCTRVVDAFVGEKEMLGFRGIGGTAVIVDLEQNLTSAQRQLMQAMYPGKWERGVPVKEIVTGLPRCDYGANLIYWLLPGGVDITKPGVDFDTIGEVLDKCGADLVMLDPVYKLMMGSPSKESETIEGFIDLWGKLRSSLGFGTLLPMHPRKPPAQGGGALTMHDLYGHAHWSWWGETILMLRRLPDSNGAILRIEKDRESELTHGEEWSLSFDQRTGFERSAADLGADGSVLPAHEKIWQHLQRLPPGSLVTRDDLAGQVGLMDKTVRQATQRLEKRHDLGDYPGLVIDAGHRGIKLYGFRVEATPMPLEFGEEDEDE